MGTPILTEWWLDESTLPEITWARLCVLPDGTAEVLDANENTTFFASAKDAADSLSQDEYRRLQSVDPEELWSVGIARQDLVPPQSDASSGLREKMHVPCEAAEVLRDLAAVRWLEPWRRVTIEERSFLELQLRAELHREHLLHERNARAYLRRIDCDDTLFILSNPIQLAVVHLTFVTKPGHPNWPRTELYDHVWKFVDRTHLDAAAYGAG
jgi:hypothetical protein